MGDRYLSPPMFLLGVFVLASRFALISSAVFLLGPLAHGTQRPPPEAFVKATCVSRLGEDQQHLKRGVNHGQSDVITRIDGSRVTISIESTGQLWRSFDLDYPIDDIALVEYPVVQGIFHETKTMAVVRSGSYLISIDVQQEPPAVVTIAHAEGPIVDMEIGHVTYQKDDLVPGLITVPSVGVEVKGTKDRVILRIEGAELIHHSGPRPFRIPRLAEQTSRAFRPGDAKLLFDLGSVHVVSSDGAVFLHGPVTQGSLYLADAPSGEAVRAVRLADFGFTKTIAIAVGSKFFCTRWVA